MVDGCGGWRVGLHRYGFIGAYLVFVVVFFKQKTAYEMRISDWSSDVCSSDLPLCLGVTCLADLGEQGQMLQALVDQLYLALVGGATPLPPSPSSESVV